MRESGFYWVVKRFDPDKDGIIIAEYDAKVNRWYLCGNSGCFNDDYFRRIGTKELYRNTYGITPSK